METEIQKTPEPKEITRRISAAQMLDDFFANAIIDDPKPTAPAVWPSCPWHGPFEANEAGNPMHQCDRCAKRS